MTKRIVSFLPSATELIYELGAQDLLFGVTHECQYPQDARSKSVLIRSVFDPDVLTSKEIDEMTTELLRDGKDIFILDEKKLIKADPDLIVSQTTCEVCAAHNNQVARAMKILGGNPRIYSMDPHSITDILDGVTEFARVINREEGGVHLKARLSERVSRLKRLPHMAKPRVLAIEWIDPFFTAGHWVPEMVEIAGGTNSISKRGEHSRRLSFDEISAEDPDYIIFMPCGFDAKRGILEYYKTLGGNKKWNGLRAVKNGKTFVVDADSFFSKPSIRTITGIEILTKILHSEIKIETPQDSFFNVNDIKSH